jgi:hypothetical protein
MLHELAATSSSPTTCAIATGVASFSFSSFAFTLTGLTFSSACIAGFSLAGFFSATTFLAIALSPFACTLSNAIRLALSSSALWPTRAIVFVNDAVAILVDGSQSGHRIFDLGR